MFINGEHVGAATGATMEVRNPATGAVVDTVPKGGAEDTRRAIAAAEAAFPGWSKLSPHKRAHALMQATVHVREHLDEIARLLTSEQGKPIRDARIEAERFADNIEIYAGLVAGGALSGRHVPLPAQKAMGLVVRRPIGVVGAIIPWNFPLTLMANKIAPAMAVGNTVVVKPASTTPLATLRLAELMLEGGLPPGVLNVVTGPGGVVGEEIIRNPLVRKIGFTGETGTGKQVARSAADELKHVTLELGGSDAAIVCDDADLELAARNVAIGRFFNAGQACLAIKRVYVFESVADDFIDRIAPRSKPSWPMPCSAAARWWLAASDRRASSSSVATSSSRRWWWTCPRAHASGRRKRSARCCRSCASKTWTRRCRKRTRASSAWARASSRVT
jgi:succinate-semialdehyde dehydrogenase/glutarate-semialdehyde dehydrogenase